MTDYAYILSKKYAGSLWELIGDEYKNLEWKSNTPKPTQKELDDLAPIVAAEDKAAATAKLSARQAVLDKLGLTADEVAALLG